MESPGEEELKLDCQIVLNTKDMAALDKAYREELKNGVDKINLVNSEEENENQAYSVSGDHHQDMDEFVEVCEPLDGRLSVKRRV